MSIYNEIIAAYPELENSDAFTNLTIMLQDDCDGEGVFIAKWDYEKPLPKGLKLGK
jgi:hypothetical protein